MKEREIIAMAMSAVMDETAEADVISPSAVALATFARFGGKLIDGDPLQYAAFEHFKQIARRVVTGRFDPVEQAADETEQQELFNGVLQKRYPVPAPRDGAGASGDRQYKLLEKMTDFEAEWNMQRMSRAAGSLQLHVDAMRAYITHRRTRQSA